MRHRAVKDRAVRDRSGDRSGREPAPGVAEIATRLGGSITRRHRSRRGKEEQAIEEEKNGAAKGVERVKGIEPSS